MSLRLKLFLEMLVLVCFAAYLALKWRAHRAVDHQGNISRSTMTRQKMVYEIDGARFSTLEGFYDEVSRILIPGADWGRNLDAFNDILRGGFGTPDEGFTLVWKNSEESRLRLGYPETVRQLELRLTKCHPSNREYVSQELEAAKRQEGQTVFDWLIKIIVLHGAGWIEAQDQVELVLK